MDKPKFRTGDRVRSYYPEGEGVIVEVIKDLRPSYPHYIYKVKGYKMGSGLYYSQSELKLLARKKPMIYKRKEN